MVDHLQGRGEKPVSEQSLLEKLRELEQEKGSSLAFKVVFQRALIEAIWRFQKLDSSVTDADPDSVEELFEEDDSEDSPHEDEGGEKLVVSLVASEVATQADRFVKVLNQVIDAEPDWLTDNFLCGAGASRKSYWLGALSCRSAY